MLEQVIEALKPAKYVLAVSGGVDSAVLAYLARKRLSGRPGYDFVIAHFDHGIRRDSAGDRLLVKEIARSYGFVFVAGRGRLGQNASEARARSARYKFLNEVKRTSDAAAVVTAHHQDDVIETAIINLLRGTYRKGLSSLSSRPHLIRPFIEIPKAEIIDFAQRHRLKWRDDPSNLDVRYLRNYVRHQIIPRLDRADSAWRERFLAAIRRSRRLNASIDKELRNLLQVMMPAPGRFKRADFLRLSLPLAREFVQAVFRSVKPNVSIDRKRLERAVMFVKTAGNGKVFTFAKDLTLRVDKGQIIVESGDTKK